MSAKEIIEQIKALPANEQAEVKLFARELPEPAESAASGKMDADKARQISRRIFAENHELFRKLAQ